MESKIKSGLSAAAESQDYISEIVPQSARRGPVLLGLLWITMVTGFPSVLAGFDWFREGLTLTQVLACSAISIAILMAYSVPACLLGSQSGQTYALLSRRIFGRFGSLVVSLNVAWISILWYGLTAYFLASGLQGIFHLQVPIMLLSAVLAALMSLNNLLGFAGVANFAAYLAAPVLIIWIVCTFAKVGGACPASVWNAHQTSGMFHALPLVSAFVIGYAAWGNEPDYWRYSRHRLSFTIVPLLVSLLIGAVMFPVTGWLMAYITGVTNYSGATDLMTKYVFGGMSWLAAIVLFVTYCAQNDANLYAAINGIANLKQFPRRRLALFLIATCTLCAVLLSASSNSFEAVASASSTILPCPTVVMIVEWYILCRLRNVQPDFATIPDLNTLPVVRWPACAAIIIGSGVGLLTAGIIPGLEHFHVGVCSLQAWVVTFVVYVLLRTIELRSVKGRRSVEQAVVEDSVLS